LEPFGRRDPLWPTTVSIGDGIDLPEHLDRPFERLQEHGLIAHVVDLVARLPSW
jgi:hypothetical protein